MSAICTTIDENKLIAEYSESSTISINRTPDNVPVIALGDEKTLCCLPLRPTILPPVAPTILTANSNSVEL